MVSFAAAAVRRIGVGAVLILTLVVVSAGLALDCPYHLCREDILLRYASGVGKCYKWGPYHQARYVSYPEGGPDDYPSGVGYNLDKWECNCGGVCDDAYPHFVTGPAKDCESIGSEEREICTPPGS